MVRCRDVDPCPGQRAATYTAPCAHANQYTDAYTIADLRATSPDVPAAPTTSAGDVNADPGPDVDAWTVQYAVL